MNESLENAKIYGIVDLGYVDFENIESAAESLIRGGADVIQLRAKGVNEAEIESLARKISPICKISGIPFIVNDHAAIAARVNADGVHIGQDDGTLLMVREIVGEKMMVGRSTHTVEQAQLALREGFDYIGFGPLFPTPTKKGRAGIGMENVRYVEETVGREIPVFCIGGITRSNICTVVQAGANRMVIVSDLLRSESIEEATAEAKNLLTAQQ